MRVGSSDANLMACQIDWNCNCHQSEANRSFFGTFWESERQKERRGGGCPASPVIRAGPSVSHDLTKAPLLVCVSVSVCVCVCV